MSQWVCFDVIRRFGTTTHLLIIISSHVYWELRWLLICNISSASFDSSANGISLESTEWFRYSRFWFRQYTQLYPSDAIWWHNIGSTLVQVMACYPMAPRHYLHQYWLLICGVPRNSPESNFTSQVNFLNKKSSNHTFKVSVKSVIDQWAKTWCTHFAIITLCAKVLCGWPIQTETPRYKAIKIQQARSILKLPLHCLVHRRARRRPVARSTGWSNQVVPLPGDLAI